MNPARRSELKSKNETCGVNSFLMRLVVSKDIFTTHCIIFIIIIIYDYYLPSADSELFRKAALVIHSKNIWLSFNIIYPYI